MANGVYINGSQLGAIHAVAEGVTEYEFSPSNLRGSLANHQEDMGPLPSCRKSVFWYYDFDVNLHIFTCTYLGE